jgi:multiple sugar transport system substrate-binding protein
LSRRGSAEAPPRVSRSAKFWLACLAALLALLAACAPPGGGGGAEDAAEQTPGGGAAAEGAGGSEGGVPEGGGDVTFVHDKDFWTPIFDVVLARGEDELGIAIDTVPYSDTTSYQQAVQSGLPTAEAPDVLTWWSGYRLEDMVQAGHLADLSDVWDEQVAAGNLSEDLAAAFTEGDGIYAVPMHISYWPVFYNVKVFEQHGLDVPQTWEELEQVADTLVDAGVTPFFATTDGRWPAFIWFEEFIARTDPDFYDRLVNGEESYTDPLVVDAMREWGEWLEAGYFTNLDMTMDDDMASAFANGEVAMAVQGTWFNGTFQDAGLEPGVDYDTFIMPNRNPDLDENLVIFETGPLAVASNASNPDAARSFVEWWVQPETQRLWSDELRDTPATPGAEAPDPALQSIVDAMEEREHRLVERYWEASPPPIVEAAVDELSRFMLNPDQYEQVLETIEQLARSEWEARGS